MKGATHCKMGLQKNALAETTNPRKKIKHYFSVLIQSVGLALAALGLIKTFGPHELQNSQAGQLGSWCGPLDIEEGASFSCLC